MIDDSRMNSTRSPLRDALHEALDRTELLDAIADRPERLEAGLSILARDVEAAAGAEIPLLATDIDGRLAAVWAADGPVSTTTLAEALATARRLHEHLPMLRKILASAARSSVPPIETDRLRVLFVAPSIDDEARDLATIVASPVVEFVRARIVRIGDTRALCLDHEHASSTDVELEASHGAETTNGGDRSRAHRQRLLADARTRILNLSPEISALEARGGLVFRYRGRDLASFANEGDGLRLLSPRLPEGRRILGRSDLEDGLHAVIEEFFALYAIQPTRGTTRLEPPKPPTDRTETPSPPDAVPGDSIDEPDDESPTLETNRPPEANPMPGLRTAPLSREEIEEFLRNEDDES